jgi:hypothetical protein
MSYIEYHRFTDRECKSDLLRLVSLHGNLFERSFVLDFRISTYGLFTTLHNTIIVDIPRGLVVTHSLLQYTRFGPSHAAPSDFQQVMSSR